MKVIWVLQQKYPSHTKKDLPSPIHRWDSVPKYGGHLWKKVFCFHRFCHVSFFKKSWVKTVFGNDKYFAIVRNDTAAVMDFVIQNIYGTWAAYDDTGTLNVNIYNEVNVKHLFPKSPAILRGIYLDVTKEKAILHY